MNFLRRLLLLILAKCTLLVTNLKCFPSSRIFKNPSNSCIIPRRLQGKSMLVPQIMIARLNPVARTNLSFLVLSEIFLQFASCRFVTQQDAFAYEESMSRNTGLKDRIVAHERHASRTFFRGTFVTVTSVKTRSD